MTSPVQLFAVALVVAFSVAVVYSLTAT